MQVLKRQRTSWEPGWRDLSRYVNPGRGPFFTQPNQGDRGTQNNGAIRDPTALFALETLVAGLMSGVTLPARPWSAARASFEAHPARKAFPCGRSKSAGYASACCPTRRAVPRSPDMHVVTCLALTPAEHLAALS